MLETKSLPLCEDFDPLDAHFDELEEPGTNYLQDFIVAPLKLQSNTPRSHSNGYTSEESDYSVVTPSDEQSYHDMSFLHAAPTSELVNVVGDLCPSELTAVDPHPQQQKLTGKVAKGKTSKYRGVTQTSKTSWGAKYSAKRITNTCKTPEEAARAYDEYIKTYYPLKYAKFANFCGKCGKFVNPLGLAQFQSECKCSKSPQAGYSSSENSFLSPKKEIFPKEQISTLTFTPSRIAPIAPSSAAGLSTVSTQGSLDRMGNSSRSLGLTLNPAGEEEAFASSHRSSIMSVGSLKFSFSEDTEHFFAESFNDVATMATNLDGASMDDPQQQPLDQMRDSLPIAIITSAVDSFTQEGNLDQIISDIDRSSSSRSLLKGAIVEMHMDQGSFDTFAATGNSSNGTLSNTSSMGRIQVEPTATNSLGFNPNELSELTNYFIWENDAAAVVQREAQTNSSRIQQIFATTGRNPLLKKIHSLDFDTDNSVTESSTRSGVVVSEVKIEDTNLVNPTVATPVGMMMPLGSPHPAIIEFQTWFLDKYWRNDRKNIQCFPCCPEHGDYYRVRIENLQHRCKGVCRAPVKAHVTIPAPASASIVMSGLLVLARCNSTFSRDLTLTEHQVLSLPEMKGLQAVSVVGTIDNFALFGTGCVQFDVTFHPDVWKFEFDLPKKRRHVQSSSSAVSLCGTDGDVGGDSTSAEFLYFFEIDVFYSREKTTFERLGHTESINFQIGNTRTLLRQRNKLVEEGSSSGGSDAHANDSDKLANADELPEKKRVKVTRGRHEILPGTSFSEDGLSCRGLTGDHLSLGCDTGDGVSSSSKRDLLDDKSIPVDVDWLCSSGLKDSIFDREARSSELPPVKVDLCKDGDCEELLQGSVSDYFPYVSPKQKSNSVLIAYSPVVAAPPIKAHLNARPMIPMSPAKEEAPRLAQLLLYLLACVPLSMLFCPVGIMLLIGFLVIPPAASSIVSALDALSDMELSRANISCTSEDQRMVLNRLIDEKGDNAGNIKADMFHYHSKGEVWSRIFYFSGAKFVVSMVSLIPAFVLALLAGLLYPIRPASSAMVIFSCGCALWSREYTRKTTGKPLARAGELGGLV